MTEAGRRVWRYKKRIPFLFFLAISFICLTYSVKNRWTDNRWTSLITSDGSGYYAYLPSIFIYHNFNFDKLEKLNKGLHESCYSKDGKVFDKYFAGVAVLLTPFFLLAYFISYLFGFSTNGYSIFFQFGASIGGLFYLITGLGYTRKLLLEYKVRDGVIYFTISIVLFATNLFYYATIEPTMSHVYSFALIAGFCYYAKKLASGARRDGFWKLGCILALVVLVRPVNILSVALIPFLAGSSANTLKFIRNGIKPLNLLGIAVPALIVLALQMMVWHEETGSYFIRSYSTETFYFLHPHFWSMLFGFRKGLFVYTPVIFIAVAGGLMIFLRKDIYSFWLFLFFFIPSTYILSCWWCWYYGDSYGMRVFIDFYAIFALLLALFLDSIFVKPLITTTAITIALFLVALNCVQQYQYMHLIMSRDSMSKGRYWKVFLKTGDRYKGIFYTDSLNDIGYLDNLTFFNDFEHNSWGSENNLTTKYAHSGKYSALVDSQHVFGPGITIHPEQIPFGENLYAHYSMWLYSKDTANRAAIVINSIEPRGISDGWAPLPLKTTSVPARWEYVEGTVQFPFIKTDKNILRIFLYYSGGKGAVYVDDISIKIGIAE